MVFSSKKLFSVISGIVLLLLAFFFFVLSKDKLVTSKKVSFNSSIPNMGVVLVDTIELEKKLRDAKIIDDQNVSMINVKITDKIEDPMFIQSNQNGTVLISSRFDLIKDSKEARILIKPEEYVFNLTPQEQVAWYNSQVQNNLNLIYKGNQKIDVKDAEIINFFQSR